MTPLNPSCYGVMCPQHGGCARYHAVNNAPVEHRVIGTCDETRTTWPLFVPLEKENDA